MICRCAERREQMLQAGQQILKGDLANAAAALRTVSKSATQDANRLLHLALRRLSLR